MAYVVLPDGSIQITPDGMPPMDVPPGVFEPAAPGPMPELPTTSAPGYSVNDAPPPGMFAVPAPVQAPAPAPGVEVPQAGSGAAPPGMFRAPAPAAPPVERPAPNTHSAPAPTYEQQSNDATRAQQEAVRQKADVEAKAQADEGQRLRKIYADEQTMLRHEQEAQAEAKARSEVWSAQLTDEATKIANTKIDPQRAFKDMGPVGQAISILGMFIGGAMQVRTGQPNPAAKGLENIMERDLQAQIQDVESQKAGLGAKQNLYGKFLDQTKDDAAARTLTRISLRTSLIQRAAAEKQIASSPATVAQADSLIAELQKNNVDDLRKAGNEKKALELDAARVSISRAGQALARQQFDYAKNTDQRDFDERQREFDTTVTANAAKLAQEGKLAEAKRIQDMAPRLVPLSRKGADGPVLVAPSEKTAEGLRVHLGVVEDLVNTLNEMDRIRKEYDPKRHRDFENQPEYQQLSSLWSKALILKKNADQLGVIAGADMGIISGQIGTSATTWKEQSARWAQTRKNLVDTANARLRAEGMYNGPRWEPSDVTGQGAATQALDQTGANANAAPSGPPMKVGGVPLGVMGVGF